MSTVMAGHKAEKEALEIRLKAAVDEYKASAAFAELLSAAKAAGVAEYKSSEAFSAHLIEASTDSFAQGFDACTY